jgi:PAS domain S-box-containing protein
MLAPTEPQSPQHATEVSVATAQRRRSVERIVHPIRDYALTLLDESGRIISWNAGAQRLYGYTASEIIGSFFTRLYQPEEAASDRPKEDLRRAASAGGVQLETWQLRQDGSSFRAQIELTALLDATASTPSRPAFLARACDASIAHEHDDALRQREALARRLVEGVRDYAIFGLDPQGRVTSWNEGARLIKGYTAEEIIGRHFSCFYPPDSIACQWPDYELRVATTEGRFEDEGWRIRKDGGRFWANVIITALRDTDGTLLGFSKITRDLTEQRKQSETLRQSEERFRLLVEGLADYAILILDSDGQIRSWNSGAQLIFGYGAEEVLWKHVSQLYRSDEIAASQPWHELSTARERGQYEGQAWRLRKDNVPFWARVRITALTDVQGHAYGYAHVTHDLTAQRHCEALEQLTRRMTKFASAMGDELQRCVADLRGSLDVLKNERRERSDVSSIWKKISCEMQLMAHIVDELREVGRMVHHHVSLETELVDLAQLVQRGVQLALPLLEQQAQVPCVLGCEVPVLVNGDAFCLTQMIANVLHSVARCASQPGEIHLALEAKERMAYIRVQNAAVRRLAEDLLGALESASNHPEMGGRSGGVALALVRRTLELHGGSARLGDQASPCELVLALPLADDEGVVH